jgi:hypothetical protein
MTPRVNEVVCAVVLSAALISSAPAQENQDLKSLQEENAQLRNRVDNLENELSEIKKTLGKPAEPTTPAPVEFTDAQMARLKKLADSKKNPVLSAFDIELYGYVKLDLAHDSALTSVGNYARWVESAQGIKDHGQFSLTADQTRLDLKATGPAHGQMQSSALVEIDFYGGGEAANRPVPMMRLAYMNLEWPEEEFSILAGQAADVISPLWMPTLNYTVGWWQGDIGYRRPQLRLTKGFELAKDVEFKLEAAVTRDIGFDNAFTEDYSDTGQDASIPGLQGRASLTLPGFNNKPTTIGVSGHWAEEVVNNTITLANPQTVDSWSINLDLTVPITTWLSLTGEAYSGRDLFAYLGGIGQGFDTNLVRGIRDNGGWAAVTLKPTPKWQFNVGGGFDKVPKGDVPEATSRTFNSVIFGNAQYAFTSNFTLGYEMSYLRTEYEGQEDGEDVREQLSLIYKF